MARAPIYVYCDGQALRPFDAYAAEQMKKLNEEMPQGEFFARLSRITAKGKDERQGLFGLWWAGCGLFAESTEHLMWDTQRKVSDRVLEGLGFVRPQFRRVAGETTFKMVPVSIAETNMDDDEFELLLERARPFMLDRWNRDPWQEWTDKQDAEKAKDQRRRG